MRKVIRSFEVHSNESAYRKSGRLGLEQVHYSPILHGCMNTRRGKSKFKHFRILLDSGYSSVILMGRLVEKLSTEKDALMQWHTKSGNITTNLNVKVDFTLPALSTTNVVTWKFHVDESAKCRYSIILEQNLLTKLVLNLTISEHVIEADDGPINGFTTPMVDLGAYIFKDLNTGKLHLKNHLLKFMPNKHMSQSMYVLLQNYCV